MELSAKETKMLKGIAVLCMVCLHLFDRYDYQNLYQPLLYIKDIPFCFYWGQLADFCVMIFAFCSGYAHMKKWIDCKDRKVFYHRRLKRIFLLYCNLWIVIAGFTFISVICGKSVYMPGSVVDLIGNIAAMNVTYNVSWWYVFTFAIIVIISPIILENCKQRKTRAILIVSLFLYFMGYYLRYKIANPNWLIVQGGYFGMTVMEYVLGAIFYKHKILTAVSRIDKRYFQSRNWIRNICLFVILIGMLLSHTLVIANMVVAPITGLIFIAGFHVWREKDFFVGNIFNYFGKHSTNIWLTHLFFYTGLFPDFIYRLKYPPIIYGGMLIICLICSYIINIVYSPISNHFMKKVNQNYENLAGNSSL